jgi:predicted Zn-dependent peptidase
MLNRQQAPPFHKIQEVHLPQAALQQLSNQIPLHIFDIGTQDVVQVEFVFYAGSWFDLKTGQSYFTIKMLEEGTQERNAQQIQEAIDQYGAFLELQSGFDQVSVVLYSLTRYLDKVLPVVKEMILQASFPEDELELLKKRTAEQIKVNSEKNAYLAARRFRELIFGAHPYGQSVHQADIEAITRNDLNTFYKQYIHLGNCEILVAGKADSSVIAQIEAVFGTETVRRVQPNYRDKEAKTLSKKEYIHKEGSLQASIRIGKQLFPKTHPDYFKMLVSNEILGGYFGSRLMQNIREEKGLTYGIYSQVSFLGQVGFFAIGTDVNLENTERAIEEVYNEVQNLAKEPVGAEELEKVKNYMAGVFAGQLTTAFSVLDLYKSAYFYQLSPDFYQNYLKNIEKVSAEDVQRMVEKYLDPHTLAQVVVGAPQP